MRVLIIGMLALSCTAGAFSNAEKQRIKAFWSAAGRYQVGTPVDIKKKGASVVRLSTAGSLWLWRYDRARGVEKGPPSTITEALTPEQQAWATWINQKVNYDRQNAAAVARMNNLAELGLAVPEVGLISELPPAPAGLVTLVGEPPSFAECVRPKRYTVNFGPNDQLEYHDQTELPKSYRYYRFSQGTRDFGTRMGQLPEATVASLLTAAGIDESVRRVFQAVSLLEGGFDSVNTYDTGYVSVGFIQFACLKDGAGSLGQVLLNQKSTNPKSFQRDFRDYGIDVTRTGSLVALNLDSYAETTGAQAAQTIIDDKRLIAIFQRAGRTAENRIAQLKIARRMYYPDEDLIAVTLRGQFLTIKVKELIKSEAGMATLMDRKVNTGKLGDIGGVVANIMERNNLATPIEAAPWEKEIVQRVKFRGEFLGNASLSQPPEVPQTP